MDIVDLMSYIIVVGNSEHDDKVKKSVSSRYAAVLILLTVQGTSRFSLLLVAVCFIQLDVISNVGNGDGLLLERYGDRLLALSAGGWNSWLLSVQIPLYFVNCCYGFSEHNNLSLTDLADWMSPLKCLANVGVKGPIPALVEQLQM